MTNPIPLTSLEVRWFFEGKAAQYEALKLWFEKTVFIPQGPDVGIPVWKGRLDDLPDVYLLLPGADDMGIKWREQELQIKGRISSPAVQVFCGRHQGEVQRWIKWSYASMPDAYQNLFVTGKEAKLITVPVHKTRALRKLQLEALTGVVREVNVKMFVEQGLGFELTDLEVEGQAYCSLAFEAFPLSPAIEAAFSGVVETFLDGLKDFDLAAAQSKSYPSFLRDLQHQLHPIPPAGG